MIAGTRSAPRLPLLASAALALVRGDTAALSIAVSNGVSNALKFGEAIEISVTRDAHALVAIEDDGPGVPAEERGRVFAPSERGSHGTSKRRHGIGLALVARVAKRHSGSARIVTRPRRSHGTRIEVRSPRVV